LNPKILIVEDDQKITFNLELMLKFNDYNTIAVKDGIEAIDTLSKLDPLPDLILCDILMPRMGGLEFFQEKLKKQEWKHIPFIFLTAVTDSNETQLARDLGADDYIVKPFNEKTLLSSIARLINQNKGENNQD